MKYGKIFNFLSLKIPIKWHVYSQIENSCIYILKSNKIRENIGFIKSEKPYKMAYVLTNDTKSVLTINGLIFVAITVYTIHKKSGGFL